MKSPLLYVGSLQLRLVLWPKDILARVWHSLLLLLALLNGISLGYIVHSAAEKQSSVQVDTLLTGLNAAFCCVVFIKDFFPGYRNILAPLPNFYPLSRLSKLGQLLIADVLSLGNLFFFALVVAFYASVGNTHFAAECASELVICIASSFIARFIISVPKTGASYGYLALLVCTVGSLILQAKYRANLPGYLYTCLLIIQSLVVTAVFVQESHVLQPQYIEPSPKYNLSLRFPKSAAFQLMAVYLPKAGSALGLAFGIKALLLAANVAQLHKNGHYVFNNDLLFYAVLSPLVSFNYVNNNTLGHLASLCVNEISRIGFTTRQGYNYVTAVLPTLLVDASISVAAILMLPHFNVADVILRYVASLLACATIGLAGSLLAAKKVEKKISFSNFKSNTYIPVNILTSGVCIGLLKLPWSIGLGLLALTVVAIFALIWVMLNPYKGLTRRIWMRLL